MAENFFPNGGRVFCSEHEPVMIPFKITAAADVAANGYAVSDGGEFVSEVTRTAEGKAKIALRQAFPGFLGLDLTTTRTATTMVLENDTSSDASDPHLDVEFQTVAASPADVDPDSAVMYFRAWFLRSNPAT